MTSRASRQTFNEFHPGLRKAAARSRRKYFDEGWDSFEARNSIWEQLEWQDDNNSQAICLECKDQFHSMRDLAFHRDNYCWAKEPQYQDEWTAALTAYVRAALHRDNGAREWSAPDIIKALQELILCNPTVKACWETLELPQHIPQPPPRLYADIFDTGNSVNPTPKGLFKHKPGEPFTALRDKGEMLVYTDGSCLNNGQLGARGGCAYVFRCSSNITWPWTIPSGAYIMHGAVFFRLEDVGPKGIPEEPTSNRAELRAVVAALRCIGTGEAQNKSSTPKNQSKLVIATDSTYVTKGATRWGKRWETNGWKSSTGEAVKNRDLWEELFSRVRVLLSKHCAKVSFWQIPRELNTEADRLANYAATLKARQRFGVPSSPIAVVEMDQS